jgi:FkbM family methyltransferase
MPVPFKNQIWRFLRSSDAFRRAAVKLCVERRLLPRVFSSTPGNALRDMLLLPESEHCSQLNQDIFALLMNRFRPGYFIEVGANDGFELSNTLYLEQHFGWTGVLVEANPRYLDSLSRRERSIVVNKAISDQAGEAEFVDGGVYGGLSTKLDGTHTRRTEGAGRIRVQCITIDDFFGLVNPPEVIDFLSIDVEGADLQILRGFVSSGRRIRCGCVEMNYRRDDIEAATGLLERSGYRVVWRDQTLQDLYFVDPDLVKGS